MIHKNEQLSKTSKLLYLKSYLVSSAAKICQNIDICETNYQVAYDLVYIKYCEIIECVENQFKILQNIKHESKSIEPSKSQFIKPIKSLVATQVSVCTLCAENH